MGFEDEGAVEGCDDVGRVVEGTELEDGSLKEKFETGPAEGSAPKVNGMTVVAGTVVESRLSVVDEGIWSRYK